jgi:hypothetical protein
VPAPNRELARALGDHVRELIARSNRTARRSAILVDSTRHRRSQETLVPQCAWCSKVRIGDFWVTPEEAPPFLVTLLPQRRTHGICPECFAEVERQAGDAVPVSRTTVVVRTAGPLATECLARALHDYAVDEQPNFVLEVRLPDACGNAVNAFLSTVSRCLVENALRPVTIELADHTYVLGEGAREHTPSH